MAFPSSPVNNQTALVNGIVYTYSSTTNAWRRSQTANIGTLNVSGTTNLWGTSYINSPVNNNGLAYNNGALQVIGGAGFGGNVYISGNLAVAGNINSSLGNINLVTVTGNTAQYFGNAAGFGALIVGIPTGYVVQPQTTLQISSNFNGYAQVNSQNINSGANASSDYIATANNGSANDTYIDMGIASSTYNYSGFGILKPNDGYLLVQGNTTTGGGNLVLTSGLNDIVFAPGGSNANNEYGRINAANVFVVKSTTTSTSTTTGAITVAGGVGVQGNLYAGTLQGQIGTATSSNPGYFTVITAANIGNSTTILNGILGATSNVQSNITTVGNLSNLVVTGSTTLASNTYVSTGNVYFGDTATFTKTVDSVKSVSGSTGTVVYDLNVSNVFYETAPAANWTVNYVNFPSVFNRAVVVTHIINQGSSAYVPTALQIGGAAQTIRWIGGNALTSGHASEIDIVSFSMIQLSAGTYIVLGQYGYYN